MHPMLISSLSLPRQEPDAGNKGISAFLVERQRGAQELENTRDKMGIRLSTTADVILEEVHVPGRNHLPGGRGKGFKLAMQTLDRTRNWNARPWRRGLESVT